MNKNLLSLISKEGIKQQPDGIYLATIPHTSLIQDEEKHLREKVASVSYQNYLETIGKNHSIPVMDYEIDKFLNKMPPGAVILDIGGCWGWHWRRIAETRPDVTVLIIDFVKSNLTHALNILKDLVGKQVLLMHADATHLPFNNNCEIFDGIWSVQTFQHIPDFKKAVTEAYRVLNRNGFFINYSLHNTPFNKFVYKILNKPFYSNGMITNSFFLARANNEQAALISKIFSNNVVSRYTEILFHPDLHFPFTGRINSIFGIVDARFLGGHSVVAKTFARQLSYEIYKK